jgi:hypothetical protein
MIIFGSFLPLLKLAAWSLPKISLSFEPNHHGRGKLVEIADINIICYSLNLGKYSELVI